MARINARIDEDLAAKLALLCERTNKSVTEIVRESIELYYQSMSGPAYIGASAMEDSGFVGCAASDRELSLRYKGLLSKIIARKVGST